MSVAEPEPGTPKPKRCWYQYSLRTLLIYVTILVIVVSLLKYEADSRKDFAMKSAIVESVVIHASLEAKAKVQDVWMHEARTNPSFQAFVENHPPLFSVAGEFTTFDTSHRYSYLRQSCCWTVEFNTPPTNINLSWLGATSGDYSENVARVNTEIVFSRPLAHLFQETRIQIVRKATPNNRLLIERLQAGFAHEGLSCEIVDQ